jgi:hypothetical protein
MALSQGRANFLSAFQFDKTFIIAVFQYHVGLKIVFYGSNTNIQNKLL